MCVCVSVSRLSTSSIITWIFGGWWIGCDVLVMSPYLWCCRTLPMVYIFLGRNNIRRSFHGSYNDICPDPHSIYKIGIFYASQGIPTRRIERFTSSKMSHCKLYFLLSCPHVIKNITEDLFDGFRVIWRAINMQPFDLLWMWLIIIFITGQSRRSFCTWFDTFILEQTSYCILGANYYIRECSSFTFCINLSLYTSNICSEKEPNV